MKKLLCRLLGHRSVKLENRASGIPDELHLCERCGVAWYFKAVPQEQRVYLYVWKGMSDRR